MPNFRFRLPAIVDLTITQQIAFTNRENSLLVTGGPGSGKTVVTIYRYRREVIEKKQVLFFTHHRTLIASIRGILRQESDILFPELNKFQLNNLLDEIRTVTQWYHKKFSAYLPDETDESIIKNFTDYQDKEYYNFYEIFIDEAQDLRPVIIEGMIMLGEKLTIGTDRSQDLNGHFIIPPEERIRSFLEKEDKETDHQELTQNFRNTKQIFEFARNFVPEDIAVQEIDTGELSDGENPTILKMSKSEQLDLIVRIIRENPNSNIGILVHVFWQINDVRDHLINNGFSCERDALEQNSFSYYYVHKSMNLEHRDLMERNLHTPFIITFDSCKGLEFDIVIMPMFEQSDWAMTHTKKKNGTEENDTNADGSLKYYANRNHYYVACTRARGQLYVLYEYKPNILSFYNENGEQ